jgi:hypothetical protein
MTYRRNQMKESNMTPWPEDPSAPYRKEEDAPDPIIYLPDDDEAEEEYQYPPGSIPLDPPKKPDSTDAFDKGY